MLYKHRIVFIIKSLLYGFIFLTIIAFANENPSCNFPSSNEDSPLVANYYIRNQSVNVEELAGKLKKYGIIAITGPAKTGKLQLAYYYAYKIFPSQLSEHPNPMVYTIPCDTQEVLDGKYYDLAIALGMPQEKGKDANNNIEKAKAYIKEHLRSESCKNRAFVLIFAGCNALSYNKLKSYFPADLNPTWQQIIITSQQHYFITDIKDKNFQISGFTTDEAVEFLKSNSNIKDEEAMAIVKMYNNLPYDLQAAKLYVEVSITPISWDYYLKLAEDEKITISLKDKENTLMKKQNYYDKADNRIVKNFISTSVKKINSSITRKYLFGVCSLFNPDNIPLPILKYLLAKRFNLDTKLAGIEFNDFLEELRDNGLILDLSPEVSPNRMAIHSITHQLAEEQINREKNAEKEIMEAVLGYFDKTSENWTSEQIYFVSLFRNSQHRLKILQYMLEQIIDCQKNSYCKTHPIRFALEKKQAEIVKLFIENGVDVNKVLKKGYLDLVIADNDDYLEIVRLLIEKKADINKETNEGWTVLLDAIDRGGLEVVKLLIEEGADVNKVDKDGRTVLIVAVSQGNLGIVKLLIEKGVDVNKGTNDGLTPLMRASGRGNLEIVRLLIEKGADVNQVDKGGRTALIVAISQDNLEMVKLLIEKGASVNKGNGIEDMALMVAISQGKLGMVKLLIEKGADVNKETKEGVTVLMVASEHGNLEIMRLLIEKGADVNKGDGIKNIALMVAISQDNLGIVKLLIEKGVDVNKVANGGNIALMVATERGNLEIVRLLVEKEADVNKETKEGVTVLMVASERD